MWRLLTSAGMVLEMSVWLAIIITPPLQSMIIIMEPYRITKQVLAKIVKK
jgi:hypothetical protein